jgi:hypothetical protein
MTLNLDKAKAGKPNPKQTQSSAQPNPQTEPQPLALPTQGKVLAMQAIAATKDDMAMIDRVMEQRKTITLQHFDAAMARCDREIESALSDRLEGDAVADFLQSTETWDDIESAFQALLTPATVEPKAEPPIDDTPAGEQTIDAPALAVPV